MDDGPAAEPEGVLLVWESRIRVLANRNIWTSMLVVLGIPSVLLGVLIAFAAEQVELAVYVPLGFMAVSFGIFVLVGLAIDLFGGFRATFILTTEGVRSIAGKGAKAAANAAILAGALTGRPGVAGAGFLAKSEQNVFIPWKNVKSAKVRGRYVLIKGPWGDKPIGLYCTPENFAQVQDIVARYTGNAEARLGGVPGAAH